MRVVMLVLLAIVFAAAGFLFGALNSDVVHIDFHLFQIPSGLGVALLSALFFGAALGGVAVTIGIVWPLQRLVRRLTRDAAALQTQQNRPAASA